MCLSQLLRARSLLHAYLQKPAQNREIGERAGNVSETYREKQSNADIHDTQKDS